MTIQRMDNVLIVVEDLEAAKAFFGELGLELEGETQVEGPEVVGYGAHSVCDGGRPESSSPGALQRLEERRRNRGGFIGQSSTARPSGASAQRHHHGPSAACQRSVRQPLPC